jgi:hypothetical protein
MEEGYAKELICSNLEAQDSIYCQKLFATDATFSGNFNINNDVRFFDTGLKLVRLGRTLQNTYAFDILNGATNLPVYRFKYNDTIYTEFQSNANGALQVNLQSDFYLLGGNLKLGANIVSDADEDKNIFTDIIGARDINIGGGNTTVVVQNLQVLNDIDTRFNIKLLELASNRTGTPVDDSGIIIERGNQNNAFIGYKEDTDKFIVGYGTFTSASSGYLTVTPGPFQCDTLEATITTASQPNITGLGALTSGSIAAGFGTISMGSQISTTGKIGAGTNSPATCALLDISGTTGGVLLPRMGIERNSIASPQAGLTIYSNDSENILVYSGNSWNRIMKSNIKRVESGSISLVGSYMTSDCIIEIVGAKTMAIHGELRVNWAIDGVNSGYQLYKFHLTFKSGVISAVWDDTGLLGAISYGSTITVTANEKNKYEYDAAQSANSALLAKYYDNASAGNYTGITLITRLTAVASGMNNIVYEYELELYGNNTVLEDMTINGTVT